MCIWVRSSNCGCLVTWFCYQLIAKPGNNTATISWPDPSDEMENAFCVWSRFSVHWEHGLHCISLDDAICGNDIQHALFIQAPGNVSLYCICLYDAPIGENIYIYYSDIIWVSWHFILLTSQLFGQKLTSHKTANFCNISSFGENHQWMVISILLSLCEGIHWGPVDSHHKKTVMKYVFPRHDVLMSPTIFPWWFNYGSNFVPLQGGPPTIPETLLVKNVKEYLTIMTRYKSFYQTVVIMILNDNDY